MKAFLIVASVCLFFTQSLFANTCCNNSCNTCCKTCCFDCFYVGGGIGGTILDGRQAGLSVGTLTEEGLSNLYTSDLAANYFTVKGEGEFFAGFGHCFGCLYLGVEAFGQYSQIRANSRKTHFHAFVLEDEFEGLDISNHVRIGPWRYGFDFRPGFLLTPTTLLYGRVGVTGAKVRFNTDAKNVFALIGETSPFVAVRESIHKHGHFLNFGLGLEKFICNHLAVRLEYLFTNYRSLSQRKQCRTCFRCDLKH